MRDRINAADPKNMKMRCAVRPHRAWTISNQVCAYGALSLSLAASWFDGVRMYKCRDTLIGTHLCKKEDLDSGTSPVPPWARNSVFVRNGTGLELQVM